MWALFLLGCNWSEPAQEAEEAPATRAQAFTDATQPRHVLFLLIDTLRADALQDANTPAIDALAARGATAERAWSAGTWTAPSVISIFTGSSIREHGWDAQAARMGRYPQLPALPTLAEVLKEAGFATAGFYSNPYLAEALGFDRGFDSWRRSADKAMPKQFQTHVTKDWADGRRHFTYLHLLGPHSPLKPSPEAQARWGVGDEWFEKRMGLEIGVPKRNRREGARENYAKAYRAVIEDTDALVGTILESLGPYAQETLVILTSDHGELLGEHNIVGHGTHVWEPLAHVPLILAHPDPAGRAQLPPNLSGAALADLVTRSLGVAHEWPESVLAPLPMVSQREGQVALSPNGVQKGIWKEDTLEGFNLHLDAGELAPVPDTTSLQAAKNAWETTTPRAAPLELTAELPKETQDQLGALGYAQ